MVLKIGDKVRFLNEVGGGRITSVVNDEMVNVETEDGFEVPTLIHNLIVVNVPDQYESGKARNTIAPTPTKAVEPQRIAKLEEPWFTDKNQVVGKDHAELFFALVPENSANPPTGNIAMYLINNGNDSLLFRFTQQTKYNYETVVAQAANPNSKVYLGLIKPEMISDLPVYCFQWLSFQKKSKSLGSFLAKEIPLSAVKFYKQHTFTTSRFFKVPVMLIPLLENPLKAELEKLSTHDFSQAIAAKESEKREVVIGLPNLDLVEIDLHIAELLDDISNMTNAEMVTVQMDKFRKELENALKTGVKKIVFIHGVGNGTLKSEVRRELDRNYAKYPMQDASFREYGFGATMVILKR